MSPYMDLPCDADRAKTTVCPGYVNLETAGTSHLHALYDLDLAGTAHAIVNQVSAQWSGRASSCRIFLFRCHKSGVCSSSVTRRISGEYVYPRYLYFFDNLGEGCRIHVDTLERFERSDWHDKMWKSGRDNLSRQFRR